MGRTRFLSTNNGLPHTQNLCCQRCTRCQITGIRIQNCSLHCDKCLDLAQLSGGGAQAGVIHRFRKNKNCHRSCDGHVTSYGRKHAVENGVFREGEERADTLEYRPLSISIGSSKQVPTNARKRCQPLWYQRY
jgi:hypothetical protein